MARNKHFQKRGSARRFKEDGRSHSQSALEYLVTYGWAFVAMVIISISLWYTGAFDPLSFAGGGKSCGGFGSFACEDFKVDSSGTVKLTLLNTAGEQINDVSIISGSVGVCAPSTVGPGGKVSCTANTAAPSGTSGAGFLGTQVRIAYADARSGIAHSDAGTVSGRYEDGCLNSQNMQGLSGWWKFEKEAGTLTPDSTSNHNDGTLSLSPGPAWQNAENCKLGRCYGFNGSAMYVGIPPTSSTTITTEDFTIATWVSTANVEKQISIITNYNSGGLEAGYLLGVNASGNPTFEYSAGLNGGTGRNWCSSNTSINNGALHHVAVVVNRMALAPLIYVDGVNIATNDIPSSWGCHMITGNINSVVPLRISGWTSYPPYGTYFNGSIDEVKLWKRALSASEIQNDYACASWTV
ncbi:LamG domain-containing protein [Candidatus Micrarchaeota archaeon]|nr:LamG domain-containing protein [Candidatus Micrarchaeota archaeon]